MTQPPIWLAETADRIAMQIHGAEALAPIGCHYYHDELSNLWEVTLFVSSTETVGGELDGKFTASRFSVELLGLAAIFSKVQRFSWQAVSMGEEDDLGPHLAVEGRVGEHKIWLRIVADAPKQFPAGRIADVYAMRFHDCW